MGEARSGLVCSGKVRYGKDYMARFGSGWVRCGMVRCDTVR